MCDKGGKNNLVKAIEYTSETSVNIRSERMAIVRSRNSSASSKDSSGRRESSTADVAQTWKILQKNFKKFYFFKFFKQLKN